MINLQELVALIKEYSNNTPITEPLFVLGENHRDGRCKTAKKILGDDGWWKITFDNDMPGKDTTYCIFNTYIGGQGYSDAVLRNCIKIVEHIKKPVFCFIDNSEFEKMPTDIKSRFPLYQLV